MGQEQHGGGGTARLPASLAGHWETATGLAKASEYASRSRAELCHGEMTDLRLANAIYMAGRDDFELIHLQTAAKERIRWLSVQLALASAALAQKDSPDV